MSFITVQFTTLAFIMYEVYKFVKFEIKTGHRQYRISRGLLYKHRSSTLFMKINLE